MKMIKRTLLLTLLGANICLANENFSKSESDESFLLNLVWKCIGSEDLGKCLKLRAAKLLDELIRMKEPLVITENLSLTKVDLQHQGFNESEGKSLKTEKVKSENLDRLIWDKLVSLFTTRTIQLSLSSNAFEGRGKEAKIFKKGHGVFLMAAMMGGMMMKMALGKIALIAGKALLVGKIALILSLIIALKKFTNHGGGGGGGGHSEVVYTSAEHGTGRSLKDDSVWNEGGNDLAYSAHNPKIY